MTDEQTIKLLEALRDYYRQYGDDAHTSPEYMTVTNLAGDLLDSLPRRIQPEGMGILFPETTRT